MRANDGVRRCARCGAGGLPAGEEFCGARCRLATELCHPRTCDGRDALRRRIVLEDHVEVEFGRPIRYSRLVEEEEVDVADHADCGACGRGDPDPAWEWRATGAAGPWMRSLRAAVDRFAALHPAAVRAIVAAAIVRS